MQKEIKRIILQWMFPLIAFVAVVATMLINFTNEATRVAEIAVEKDMVLLTERYGTGLNRDLTAMAESAVPAAYALAHMRESKESLLEELYNHSPADLIVYCDTGGKGNTHSGEAVDLSAAGYFTELRESEDDTYHYVEEDIITGEKAIVYAVKLPEDPAHLLLCYYFTGNIEKIFSRDDFDLNSFIALIEQDGNVLANNELGSSLIDQGNLLTTLESEGNTEELRRMVSRMKNGNAGSSEVVLKGESRTLIYSPLEGHSWTIIVGVQQEFINNLEEREWEYARRSLIQLALIVCGFLVLLVIINLLSKIRNTEHTRHLQEKADTDLLTGLNNKLATEQKIKAYMESHPDEQSMFFVLDIDNFKKINDTMGHAFGDEVLRSLGEQITAMFRVSDIVGRTGGDEFIILLKGVADDSMLQKEAEKVAKFFHDFSVGEYVKYSATASIGVAIYPRDGKNFETVYKAADQALYAAKQRGKNQLAFYHDSLAGVVIED